MTDDQEPHNLEELLDRMDESTHDGGEVTLEEVLETVGRRSFGPLLLLAGVITSMPLIGDIPGVPVVMGIIVALIAGQLLLHRKHLWLPEWLLNQSVSRDKLSKSIEWVRSPAQFIDRFLRPRLTMFTHRAAAHVIALACILIAAVMPVLEFIPFSANLAGAALTAFGLSLISHDGLLALLAFVFTGTTFGLAIYHFL